jgi:hypothetical protein
MGGGFSVQGQSFTVKFLKHYKTQMNNIQEQTMQVFGNMGLRKVYDSKSMEK